MPYKMKKEDKKYCVYNSDTGEKKGCSDSRSKAVGHMRALYANEKKELAEIDVLVETALKELGEEYSEKDYYGEGYFPYIFATSYAELEAGQDAIEREMKVNSLIGEFPQLARNVMISPEIEDKETAIVALANELAGLISGAAEGENDDSKSLPEDKNGAIGGGGKTIKNIIVDAVKETLAFFGIKPKEKEAETSDDVMLWKEADGWRWLVRYSNSFRDRDNPPEIISSSSHRRFAELVDKGLAPLPDLELWHVKGLVIGKATYVAYDEVKPGVGFAIAAGYFLPGTEQVAEWLNERKDLACSHGMPVSTIVRNESDQSIIEQHETREISLLPTYAAANTLTGFVAFKEADMAIPDEKKSKLVGWGMPPEMLEHIEQLNSVDAGKALESGVESKEIEPPAADEQPTESKEEPVAEVPAEAPTGETPQESPLTRNEVAEAMQAVVASVNTLSERVEAMGKELSEFKAAKEKEQQDILKDTPPASLLSRLMGGASAIGSPSTRIDEKSELADAKPKEADKTLEGPTAIPFLNKLIMNQ